MASVLGKVKVFSVVEGPVNFIKPFVPRPPFDGGSVPVVCASRSIFPQVGVMETPPDIKAFPATTSGKRVRFEGFIATNKSPVVYVFTPVPPCVGVISDASVRMVASVLGKVKVFSVVEGPVNFAKALPVPP